MEIDFNQVYRLLENFILFLKILVSSPSELAGRTQKLNLRDYAPSGY